ncbi:uncharacterized protein LOC112560610 isoform X2 [Pomacea canaliculata]|nr:uncharacterized protein LOC112560610 isoform X2 [Pomacea canaliculata]
MVHLRYPSRKDFLTWDELGCLARMLGFPQNIVKENVPPDLTVQKDGMSLSQLERMIELKLLHQALHRSFNMHTADWNLCVIRKSISLLHRKLFSFEELRNIRLAYATYEASDMKGLRLHPRTLLRTLKMCDRVISPLKLMHRVKHMRGGLEEAGRIQLYEFFDLVLWCDRAKAFHKANVHIETTGREKGTFPLEDFENLLSHEDERRARLLDHQYLAEEWDFGREKHGSKHMFKGEVVFSANRIKQTQDQKRKYRHLKTEINQSQRRVYRAHAGSIRDRPISAPNLSTYRTPRTAQASRAATATAVYRSVQRRLHSAPFTVSAQTQRSGHPTVSQYVRVDTPHVVTPAEIDEVQLKVGNLHFDILTLESRCQVNMEEEMDFYIPHYKQRLLSKDSAVPVSCEAEPVKTSDASPDERLGGWKGGDVAGCQRSTIPTFGRSPVGQLTARPDAAATARQNNVSNNMTTAPGRSLRPSSTSSTERRDTERRLACIRNLAVTNHLPRASSCKVQTVSKTNADDGSKDFSRNKYESVKTLALFSARSSPSTCLHENALSLSHENRVNKLPHGNTKIKADN